VNSPVAARYLFVALDLVNAVLVYAAVRQAIQTLHSTERRNLKSGMYSRFLQSVQDTPLADGFLLSPTSFSADYWALVAFGVYLFNPFCVASCVAQSTVLFHNLVLLLWLVCLLHEQATLAYFFLAIHANSSVYSASLCVASAFYLLQQERSGQPGQTRPGKDRQAKTLSTSRFMAKNLALFAALALAVFALNLWLEDYNTRFIKCTYLFILQVPDLVPNLGVFW